MASPSTAAVLAAAALASRRADPSIRCKMLVQRSPGAMKTSIPAPSPAAVAPLAGASSNLMSTPAATKTAAPVPPPAAASPLAGASSDLMSTPMATKTAAPAPPPAAASPLAAASSELMSMPAATRTAVPAPSTPGATSPASSATTATRCRLSTTTALHPAPAATPPPPASNRLPASTTSWVSLVDGDDDDDSEEEVAPRTPPASKRSSQSTQRAQPAATSELKASDGWQEVLPWRGPRHSTSPATMLPPRPIPAWLSGRCCRCLAHGHRAAGCRDPFRCSRCLENGHRARDCRNPWRPLSSLACLVAPTVSFTVKHRQAPSSCDIPIGPVFPKSPPYGSWASVISTPAGSAGLVPPSELVLRSTLAAQVERLEGYLARVGSVLERAETALSRLSLLPAMLMTTSTLCPPGEVRDGSVDNGAELYGSFSPRVGGCSSSVFASPIVPSTDEGDTIAAIVSPVLQVMPELQESCVISALPLSLSVEHVKVDSLSTLNSPERSDVVSASIPPASTLNADALFAKELCDVLSSLEAANPGCGRALACLLTGSTTKAKNKKVGVCTRAGIRKEKSLKCKDNKKSDDRCIGFG